MIRAKLRMLVALVVALAMATGVVLAAGASARADAGPGAAQAAAATGGCHGGAEAADADVPAVAPDLCCVIHCSSLPAAPSSPARSLDAAADGYRPAVPASSAPVVLPPDPDPPRARPA